MRIRERLARFMSGRYGVDELSRALLYAGLILWVISAVLANKGNFSSLLYIVAWAMVIYSYVRTFSKNIQKRHAENMKYRQFVTKLKDKFRKSKSVTSTDKNYRIFSCPGCGQKVRVPKGKGKIEISCPKCNTKFIKKA